MAASEEQAVRAAAALFHQALNAIFRGETAPMAGVWSHADDVIYMGPDGGFRSGWAEVIAAGQAQAAMKLGGEVQPNCMRVRLGRDIAATHSLVRAKFGCARNTARGGDPRYEPVPQEGGEWKMIACHSDVLPFIGHS